LKQAVPAEDMLDVLDQQLIAEIEPIYRIRLNFLETIQPLFAHNYRLVSGDSENSSP
jgi:recombinational DNA repair ATPase RecF